MVARSAKSDDETATDGKNKMYGVRRAPETLFFRGRVEDSALQPSLKGESEGREAYDVNCFRCAEMKNVP